MRAITDSIPQLTQQPFAGHFQRILNVSFATLSAGLEPDDTRLVRASLSFRYNFSHTCNKLRSIVGRFAVSVIVADLPQAFILSWMAS
jgi:hypothetical protein